LDPGKPGQLGPIRPFLSTSQINKHAPTNKLSNIRPNFCNKILNEHQRIHETKFKQNYQNNQNEQNKQIRQHKPNISNTQNNQNIQYKHHTSNTKKITDNVSNSKNNTKNKNQNIITLSEDNNNSTNTNLITNYNVTNNSNTKRNSNTKKTEGKNNNNKCNITDEYSNNSNKCTKISQNNRTQDNLQTLKIATLNVRTLKDPEKLTELELALENSNLDIIGLSEVRRNGESILLTKNKNLLCQIGTEGGQRGVGFILKNRLTKNFVEFKGITDRIALLKLKFEQTSLTLIQVYAPTTAADDRECEKFYASLQETLSEAKSNHNNLLAILGDFNNQIGQREIGEEVWMGGL